MQSNWRDKHFSATNGELVTVKQARKGVITLEDGRKLPAEYRQFSHGYAVTPHRSQGKTIDVPIIAAEEMNHNLFYVAISRGREDLVVITSDVQRLEESVAGSGNRQSATELARRATKRGSKRDEAHAYRSQQYQPQQDHHFRTGDLS